MTPANDTAFKKIPLMGQQMPEDATNSRPNAASDVKSYTNQSYSISCLVMGYRP
jgi:hypothetical protein